MLILLILIILPATPFPLSLPAFHTTPIPATPSGVWGFRYRVNDKRLPGTPDIVLLKYRTVIFIHECFWHGHGNDAVSHSPATWPTGIEVPVKNKD